MTRFLPVNALLRGALAVFLAAFAALPLARADDATVAVDDLAFEAGIGKFSIKHLEASGTTLAAADFKALFAGLNGAHAADLFQKLEANSIVIQEMDLEQTIGQGKSVVHYHDIKLSDIHAGKVGSFTIANGEVDGQLADGQSMQGTLLGMAGTEIDLPGLVRVLAEASSSADAPLTPLYGTSVLDGYTVKSPMFEFSVGKTAMSDIRGRPLTTPMSGLFGQLSSLPKPGETPTPEQQKASMALVSSMLDIYAAFSFAAFDMHDLRFSATGNPALSQPPLVFSAKRFLMTDYSKSGLGEVRLEGMAVGTPNGDFHIGSYAVKDTRIKPGTTPWSEIMKYMPQPAQPGKPPTPEQLKASMDFMSSIIDIYAGLSVGSWEMDDLGFSAKGDAAGQQGAGSGSIKRIAMKDFANFRIGEFSIDGFDAAPPTGAMHLGKFSALGFDFSDWAMSVKSILRQAATDPTALQTMGSKMKMPRIDSLALADLNTDYAAPAHSTDADAPRQQIHVQLGGMEFKPVLGSGGLPASLTSSIDHLIFNLPPNTPNVDILTSLGFDKFDLSSKFDARWDEAKQQLTVSNASLSDASLGKLEIASSLDSVPPEAFSSDPFMRQAAWLGALVKSADIRFDNQRLLDLVIAAQAKQMGKSPDEARSDLIIAAAAGIPALLGNSPAARELGAAVAKFLANPKSLHIVLTAKDGIGSGDAAAPDHMLDKVELKATANE